jgi:hypothetical protein
MAGRESASVTPRSAGCGQGGPRPVQGVEGQALDAEATELALASIRNPERRMYAERVVAVIERGGDYGRSASVCEFGHRLHSIVTRTPRVLRDAFRIWGEPLVDIDVSNCQPLLLGLLARAAWWRRIRASEKTRETTERRREEREEEAEPTGRVLSSILRTDLDECVQTPDLIDYIDICRFGGFYQAMAGILEMPCFSRSELARVKVESMRLIFGRHRPSLRSWMRFSDRWPTVASHLAELKRDGHRNASRVLQRAESSLMIEGVVGELMERQPDLPVLSIHDGLLVPASGVDSVAETVNRVWGLAGAVPHLKTSRPA